MWICCVRTLRCPFTLTAARSVRWRSDVVAEGLREAVSRRFRPWILRQLHRWDGMSTEQWYIIYRDNYTSRLILLATMAIPLIVPLVSQESMADIRDGRLLDAFKDTDIVRQMGVFVVFPLLTYIVVTCLAWRLNSIRLHRIYVNKSDQKTFAAVVSRYGVLTQKILFTRHNVRILESAGHRLLSFVKGSIRINKRRFALHDEGFRDIRYQSFMLGRITKLPGDLIESTPAAKALRRTAL